LVAQHKLIEAEAMTRETLSLQRGRLGPEHPETLGTLGVLARTLMRQLRYAEATQTQLELVDLSRRVLGELHPSTASALTGLGVLYDRQNLYAAAVEAMREAQRIYVRSLGPDHPNTITTKRNIGTSLSMAYRLDEAEPIVRDVLATTRRVLGEEHPSTLRAWSDLNMLLRRAGRTAEARDAALVIRRRLQRLTEGPAPDPLDLERFAEFLLQIEPKDVRDPVLAQQVAARAVAATDHKRLNPLIQLAVAQRENGQVEAALATLQEAMGTDEGMASWTAEATAYECLVQLGRLQEAERLLLDNRARKLAIADLDPVLLAHNAFQLGELAVRQQRWEVAAQWFHEALGRFRVGHPETDWRIGRVKVKLGRCRLAAGANDEAERLMLEGFQSMAADPRVRMVHIADARAQLVQLYEATHRPLEAERWRERDLGRRDP
jgi:tetratricopeptide (TPR) repeat protein